FPGVQECMRLVDTGKAKGEWADIIAGELAANAKECLPELVEVFKTNQEKPAALYVMMALDIARLEESVPFLVEVLHDGNERFRPYAKRALKAINTREARQALYKSAT